MDRDCCRASKRSMLQGHNCKATHGFSHLSVCFLGSQNSILELGESDEMSWKFPSFFKKRREKKKKTPHMQTHTFIFPHILPFGSVERYASVRECCESVDFLKRGPRCFHHLRAVPSQRTARARMVPHAT